MHKLSVITMILIVFLAGMIAAQEGNKAPGNPGDIIRTKSDKAPAISEVTAKIKKSINNLGNSNIEVRDSAERELAQIGRPAIAELNKALRSANKEVSVRAGRILDILKRIPSDEDMIKLAEDLTNIIIQGQGKKGGDGVSLDEKVRKIINDFARRYAPADKIKTYQTGDKKTLTISLGCNADSRNSGAGVVIKAVTRWVIAVGGQGLEYRPVSTPLAGGQMPEGSPGDAVAEAVDGIAIALAGNGMVIYGETGVISGGSGGDAKAVSQVYGLALCGLDRTGSSEPPRNGKAEGSGSIAKAMKFLSEPTEPAPNEARPK